MATTTRHHIEMTRLDSSGNKYILYPKSTIADVHTSSTSGETIEGKVNFYGSCATAAATAAKTATITGFKLVAGVHVVIKFTYAVPASATLNINSTGAKAIYYNGAAITADMIVAGRSIEFVYDGSYYHVIGGLHTPRVSNANTTKFYLTGTPNNASGIPSAEYFDTGVYVSATSGNLTATSFTGSGAGLTNLNASNLASGTVPADRLGKSGVTAGTYGNSGTKPAHGGTIKVPKIVVDAKGRITSASDVTITLPADSNTDTKVKSTVANTTKAYLVASTSNAESTGELVKDTGVYLDTTSGRLRASSMYATTYYLGGTSSYINSTDYTGKAASVGTLSGWIVDSCASVNAKGVTTKALSANQGYLLQNQINTLNNKVPNINLCCSGYSKNTSTITGSSSHTIIPMTNTDEEMYEITSNGGIKVPYTGYYIVSASAYISAIITNKVFSVGVYVRKQTTVSGSYTETGISQRLGAYSSTEGTITTGAGLLYLQDGEILSLSARIAPYNNSDSFKERLIYPDNDGTFLNIIYMGTFVS